MVLISRGLDAAHFPTNTPFTSKPTMAAVVVVVVCFVLGRAALVPGLGVVAGTRVASPGLHSSPAFDQASGSDLGSARLCYRQTHRTNKVLELQMQLV